MIDKTTTPEPIWSDKHIEDLSRKMSMEPAESDNHRGVRYGLTQARAFYEGRHSPLKARIQELEDQVKALRDAQSKPIQGEVDGWISVDDRLPEYGNPVLIVVLDITSMGYREKITGGGHMWFYIDGDPISYSEEPTHWQPLPPPPVRASPQ
jgi:hypothetical protein